MAAISIAAGAGLFGNGPLSGREAHAGDGLAVQYPRFARAHAPLELTVEWLPRERLAELWIARSYLDSFEVEEILPPPSTVSVDATRVHYTFLARDPAMRIGARFRLKPEHAGQLTGFIGASEELEVEVRHFVFP
jgi:hypothetical protein